MGQVCLEMKRIHRFTKPLYYSKTMLVFFHVYRIAASKAISVPYIITNNHEKRVKRVNDAQEGQS